MRLRSGRRLITAGAVAGLGGLIYDTSRRVARQVMQDAVRSGAHAAGRYVGNAIRSRAQRHSSGRRAVVGIAPHGAASYSRFKYRYGRRRPIRTNTATKTLEVALAGRQSCGTGRQSNDTIVTFWDKSDLADVEAEFGSASDTEYMILRPSSVKLMITNQTQATGQFYIYDIVCRKSCDLSPSTIYNNDLKNQFNITTYDVANVLPHKPYQSPAFRHFFKIKSCKKVVIEPGAIHVHHVTANTNARMYENGWEDGPAYIAGLTSFVMVQHHGFPVNDATTVTNVSTCDIIYDWMAFYKWNITIVETSKKTGVINALPSDSIVPRTIMEESTAVENVDAA